MDHSRSASLDLSRPTLDFEFYSNIDILEKPGDRCIGGQQHRLTGGKFSIAVCVCLCSRGNFLSIICLFYCHSVNICSAGTKESASCNLDDSKKIFSPTSCSR